MLRVALGFGDFGWQSLRETADAMRASPEDLVSQACVHYLEQVRADPERQALRLPRREEATPAHSIEVTLNEPLAGSVQAASEQAGGDLEGFVRHAVFVFISDLATGRAKALARGTARGDDADDEDLEVAGG